MISAGQSLRSTDSSAKSRPVSATPARPSESADKFLLWMTVMFIVVAVGRVTDIVPGLAGLPLVKVALGLAFIALISRWKILAPLGKASNTILRLALSLAILAVLSIAFSVWPGQSLVFLTGRMPIIVLAVILISKLACDWQTLRSLSFALLVAGVILSVPGLLNFSGGRMSIHSMYDTNDLAYVFVALFPLALGFAFTSTTRVRKLVYFGIAALFVVAVMLTSSRGGMLGTIAVLIVVALDRGKLAPATVDARGVRKSRRPPVFASLMAFALIAVASWPLLPAETRERLSSVLSLESDYNMSAQTGRVQIWKRGIRALGERPIGFGVDAYAMVDLRYGGKMFTAHNSMVQIAIELGVVGFALYASLYLAVWRGLGRARAVLAKLATPDADEQQQAVTCRMLQASLVGNLVAGMFLSSAYFLVHWIAISLAAGLMAYIQRQHPAAPVQRPRAALPLNG